MILEKVYDELYGMIEDLKKKINAAEKSDVTITPALESGIKLADYEIDGTEGVIYAPAKDYSIVEYSLPEAVTVAAGGLYGIDITELLPTNTIPIAVSVERGNGSDVFFAENPLYENPTSTWVVRLHNFYNAQLSFQPKLYILCMIKPTTGRTKTTKKK